MKKSFVVLFLFMLFVACKNDKVEKFDFSLKSVERTDFQICENGPCPAINLNYLIAEGNNGVSKKINETMSQRRIGIFTTKEGEILAGTLEIAVKNFISDYQEFRGDYPEFPGEYDIQISEKILYRNEKKVVIQTDYYIYTGGAHGYGATMFDTFSLETGNLLVPRDLFSDLDAFEQYAEKKFREKYEVPLTANINSTGFFFLDDTFSLPNNMAVLQDKVILLYNPYEAAAYAYGQLEIELPKSEIDQWLKHN